MFVDLLRRYRPLPGENRPLGPFGLILNRPHQTPGGAVFAEDGYLLAIVEFDDQGLCYDRRQMAVVSGLLAELRNYKPGPVILVFVHGWRHTARSDDENLTAFRRRLAQTVIDAPDRPVLGIYIGWRGLTWFGPPPVEWASFYTRKDAALRLALGSARELLGRVRLFRNDGIRRGTEPMLVVIGHSFGGLVVYSAVAQSLMEAAATAPDVIVPGFADLVLLINPAFEAIRYAPLHQEIMERTFVSGQPSVFISVTAENDSATGTWFPLGMRWASLGETANRNGEKRLLINTMGHVDWMITHDLSAPEVATRAKYQPPAEPKARTGDQTLGAIIERVQASVQGPVRRFTHGTELNARGGFPAHNPFWVVRASPEVIDEHNGIYGYVFADFIRELVVEQLMRAAAQK